MGESRSVEMAVVMEPNDANFLGKVFGGTILSKIDLCAYATASRYAGTICVTASFDRVDFIEPIELGELVTLVGSIGYVGRTSIEVTIEVYAENVFTSRKRHTNTARVTMVAMKDGKPHAVPPLECTTREQKIAFLEGKVRRKIRQKHIAEREQVYELIRRASDGELSEWLDGEVPIPAA